jgi:hypothetical protein
MRRFNENFVSLQRPNPAHDLNRLVIAEAPGKQESIEGHPSWAVRAKYLILF